MITWVADPLPISLDGQLQPTRWSASDNVVDLPHKSVHVWFARTSIQGEGLEFLIQQLDQVERQKMSRFVLEPLRHRYARAHGLLRLLLSRYVGCPPYDLIFSEGSHGKPSLANSQGLNFSLSHTDDAIAVAISKGVEIGVDIERIKSIQERDELVNRFFSLDESILYQSLPSEKQEQAFFRMWTRKEAFVKGLGLGLSYPLESFSVGVEVPVALKGAASGPWSVRHLEPVPGFVGAIAMRSHECSLSGGIIQLSGLI